VLKFLREHWLWLLLPFVLVAGAIVLALVYSKQEGETPFVYPM
jgi:hypothetical protein